MGTLNVRGGSVMNFNPNGSLWVNAASIFFGMTLFCLAGRLHTASKQKLHNKNIEVIIYLFYFINIVSIN